MVVSALEARIQTEYEAGGYTMGYKLLYSPLSTLTNADVAFIGINPGGDHGGRELAMPSGRSAYVDESWGTPPGESRLQLQVRGLFTRLGVEAHEVLAGNLVPFRSPSRDRLENPERAVQFGVDLWADILADHVPSTIVAMGTEVFTALAEILRAPGPEERIPVGWGRVSARRVELPGGRLIGLPHLSRFPIIRRAASQPALDRLLEGTVESVHGTT